jgi:large subunit ribosomal protein L4
MANVSLMSPNGVAAGTVELAESVFGVQPNVPVMHQVVTAQLAARRAGTQSTKTRAEVSGGGKKPFKQKGTGNARQGSTRAPHWSGGGVAHGPKPRKYLQKTPKKMIALALRSALSDRAAAGKVVVVDSWGWTAPKTSAAVAVIDKLGITGKMLVVVDPHDEATIKSFRNLKNVQLVSRNELNAYDVLCNDYIVFSQDVLPAGIAEGAPKASRKVAPKAAPAAKEAAAPKAAVAKPAAKKAAAPRAVAAAPATTPAVAAETVTATDSHADDATVTTTVTVRTIVDGVETVEVLERSIDHVAADSIVDTNPDAVETTVHITEQTIVGGKVVESSESFTTEESDS